MVSLKDLPRGRPFPPPFVGEGRGKEVACPLYLRLLKRTHGQFSDQSRWLVSVPVKGTAVGSGAEERGKIFLPLPPEGTGVYGAPGVGREGRGMI